MIKKVLITTIIASAIYALVFGVMSVSAETIVDSGICGDKLTWTLSDQGLLTISGEGDMSEWNSPFQNNLNIKKVKVEDGVKSLGWYAFYFCENLTSVELPESLEKINSYAFAWCDSLTNLKIPKNVKVIGGGFAAACGNLYIEVDENNNDFCDVDGVLYNKDMTKIIAYSIDTQQTTYEIPQTVIIIGEKAFANCYNLENVIFPENISDIKQEAFRNCWDLQNIEIPETITRLESQVFYNCRSFTNIKIEKNINYIGAGALAGCGNLDIEVSDDNPNYCAVDGVLFTKDMTELVTYSKDNKQTSYTIPAGVETIASLAFSDADSLKNIVLPKTLKTISEYAFQGCNSIIDMEITDNVKVLAYNAFAWCNRLETVKLPKSLMRIEAGVFDGCMKLSDVYYDGSKDVWDKIEISTDGNSSLLNANIHFKSASEVQVTVSADGKSFDITPVNIENGKTVILALYDGGKFVEMQHAIYIGETIHFTTTKAYTEAKVMVWNNLTNLKPACNVAEC